MQQKNISPKIGVRCAGANGKPVKRMIQPLGIQGQFAYHEILDEENTNKKAYSITHMKSGCCWIKHCKWKSLAAKICKELNEMVQLGIIPRELVESGSPTKIFAGVSDEVKLWTNKIKYALLSESKAKALDLEEIRNDFFPEILEKQKNQKQTSFFGEPTA